MAVNVAKDIDVPLLFDNGSQVFDSVYDRVNIG
jgi:hypothetical protein